MSRFQLLAFSVLAALAACSRFELGGYGESGFGGQGGEEPRAGTGANGSRAGAPNPSGGRGGASVVPPGGDGGDAGVPSGSAGEAGTPSGGGAGSGGSAGTGGNAAGGEGDAGSGGDAGGAGEPGGSAGFAGAGPDNPSCRYTTVGCGSPAESCCERLPVPGGTFARGGRIPSSVSSFHLDKYEVTVARFRAFLAEYDAWRAAENPTANAGALRGLPDTGWSTKWNTILGENRAFIEFDGAFCQALPFFSTIAPQLTGRDRELLPANCANWYEAYAFCIWDGGRLPTFAEFEYAASGGSEARTYPWGETAPTLDYAVFDCSANDDPNSSCTFADILRVGSAPLGDARWGHRDLGGSVNEWLRDAGHVEPTECHDCVHPEDNGSNAFRGGSWNAPASDMQTRNGLVAGQSTLRLPFTGFRCARDTP